MPNSPRPDWGQSHRRLGPAGGKHTRSNQGQKGGCLDVIVIGAGTAATLIGGIAYGITQVVA